MFCKSCKQAIKCWSLFHIPRQFSTIIINLGISQKITNSKQSCIDLNSLDVSSFVNANYHPFHSIGVLLVAQTGNLDQCAEFMNSRYQQKKQVSKIEKFGYGVMMTQISTTAPGMFALEKAGK